MERFLLTHPELQDNIKYNKNFMQNEEGENN